MFQRAKYKDDKTDLWESIPDPAASPKLDGGHYYLAIDGKGDPKFISRRQGVKGNYPERQDNLPHLAGPYPKEFRNQIFSVELIHTGHSKNNIESHPAVSGILNSLPNRAMATQAATGPVRAVLLDVIHPALPTYKKKLEHLKSLEKAYNKPNVLYTIPVETTKEGIKRLIDSTKKTGREGVIVTSLNEPETSNPRLKIKHHDTWNLLVTKINQEIDKNGIPKQSAGALVVADKTGREVATVGTGFSKELRADIFSNPNSWIGRPIQVKSFGLKVNRLSAPVYNGEPDGDIDEVTG